MNYQSKINVVRARIEQIKTSDLFSSKQKQELIRLNREELLGYQLLLKAERINQVKNPESVASNNPY